MIAQEFQGDPIKIITHMEQRMMGYFSVADDPDDPPVGQVAEARVGFPYNFGQYFPLGAVSELTHEGERFWGTADETPAPGIVEIGVRIYTPSLVQADPTDPFSLDDGREEARRISRAIYGAWREAFWADYDFLSRFQRQTEGAVVEGDHDEVGNPFTVPNNQSTVLWVYTTPFRFIL